MDAFQQKHGFVDDAIRYPSWDEIEAAKTPAGGFTKAQLAAWGVSWPPKSGWKYVLIEKCKRQRWKAKYGTETYAEDLAAHPKSHPEQAEGSAA
jgi:hypothetical protein